MVEFGRDESRLIKGIAIQMMVFHHLIGFPNWVSYSNQWHSVSIIGQHAFIGIAYYFKICVGIYIFITGYSLGLQKNTFRMRSRKINTLLKKYWFYYFLFIVIGLIFQEPLPPISLAAKQLLGLCTATGYSWDYHYYIHPIFAWYVSVYILFLLSFSLLERLFTKKGLFIDFCITYFVINVCYVGYHQLNLLVTGPDFLLSLFRLYAIYAPIGVLGYLFKKYEIFKKLDDGMHLYSRRKRHLLGASLLIISFILRSICYLYFGLYTCIVATLSLEAVFVITFIIGALLLCDVMKNTCIYSVLMRLQKHNFGIWMLQGIFFTPMLTFQSFAYWGKHPVIIFAFSMVLLLFLSAAFDSAYCKISKMTKKLIEKAISV